MISVKFESLVGILVIFLVLFLKCIMDIKGYMEKFWIGMVEVGMV